MCSGYEENFGKSSEFATAFVFLVSHLSYEKNRHRLELNQGVVDKFSECSHRFSFVTFDEKQAMDEAIEEKAQPQGSGRDQDGDRSSDRGPNRDIVTVVVIVALIRPVVVESACGKPGHSTRECPSEEGRGGSYAGSNDRYGGGGGGHYGPDRNGGRPGGCNRDSGTQGGS
ncbi:hypothetical protein ACJRO7_026819 [Eucalyptus globulus]|uniref:CCHC-type domain-containing protein n=1 Tax=Eucalyptus globulus TaxID=34317 RepID=A0ABD3JPH8_EUCGL